MGIPSYDVIIIGGGQAGVPLAHALAKQGKRVALVERNDLGGSCVNFGCTPTKAAFASARVAHLARRAKEFGVVAVRVEPDFPGVLARARAIAKGGRDWLEHDFSNTDNPRLLYGRARLDGRDGDMFRIDIGDRVETAAQVVLDTGTRSTIPPIDGLASANYIHAENWLEHTDLPAHIAIIGGSYIGIEMAQFYRRMGCHVTVIEQTSQILDREDEDVVRTLQHRLEGEDIRFLLGSRVCRVEPSRSAATLMLAGDGAPPQIDVTDLFIAVGRTPNTDDLGLDTVGVQVTEKGFIEVDNHLAAGVPGIWAAGDIRGGPMFTHTSWDDHRILLSQIAGDGSRTTERIVPYAVFTDPELGRVGMTEKEAREAGLRTKVGRFEMANNNKAVEIGEKCGFVKVVVDSGTDRILGAAVLACEGAEIVHILIDAMNAGAPFTVIRDSVFIHPTLSEAVQSAILAID